MRTYGLTYRGKDEGRWNGRGNRPAHFCSCCYSKNQGYIMYGRDSRKKRRLKRNIKRKARNQAKKDITKELRRMGR